MAFCSLSVRWTSWASCTLCLQSVSAVMVMKRLKRRSTSSCSVSYASACKGKGAFTAHRNEDRVLRRASLNLNLWNVAHTFPITAFFSVCVLLLVSMIFLSLAHTFPENSVEAVQLSCTWRNFPSAIRHWPRSEHVIRSSSINAFSVKKSRPWSLCDELLGAVDRKSVSSSTLFAT